MHYMREDIGRACKSRPLGKKGLSPCVKRLAESIILQSIEDLWDGSSMAGSVTFFTDKGFSICAGIAGMDIHAQVRLLEMVNSALRSIQTSQHPDSASPGL